MSIYVVSRHLGAIEFFKDSFPCIDAIFINHINDLYIDKMSEHDTVYGVLPVQLIYKLTQKNIKYFHLDFCVPETRRGQEFELEELKVMKAKWVEYMVYRQ